MNPTPQVDKVSKHTITLPDGVYTALEASAERQGLEPNDLIQNLIVEHVIAADTLDKATQEQIQAYQWLVAKAVEYAKERCRQGNFSPALTADTFKACAGDPEWASKYRFYVQDDIFKGGNPRKGPINRAIGYRIRQAIGAQVEKNENGTPVLKKVLGHVIQSYTPFTSYDPSLL
jgi:hypothetical protein